MMKQNKPLIRLLLTLTLTSAAGEVSAGTADISFTGTLLIAPSCKVTSPQGARIEVDFGDRIGVKKIDGVRYRKPLNYKMTCKSSPSSGMELLLTLKGDMATFDTTKAAVQSTVKGLAIRILQNGSPMVINQKYKVTPTAMPTLEAVPVKQDGVTLKEGPFEATANLIAEYQ